MRSRSSLIALLLALACDPELGECDPVAAVRVVHDSATGSPAYEGQAIVIASCAANGVCHATGDSLGLRQGVPAGLNFDVQLSGVDGTVDDEEIARQRRGRFRVVQEARHLLGAVESGSMPPPPPAGDLFFDSAPRYLDGEGEALSPAGSREGREILRNWLACGAPVVERTVPREDGVPAVVVPAEPIVPLLRCWPSVHTDLLRLRCAGSLCHGGNPDAGFEVSEDPQDTLQVLLESEASGEECGGAGRTMLVMGAPDASLLYTKLAGTHTCGARMPTDGIPLPPADLETLRAWIQLGDDETLVSAEAPAEIRARCE